MILVSDIMEDVAETLGTCATDTSLIFRRLNAAVKLLAAKGEWDPLQAEVTIAVNQRHFILPSDAEVALSVAIDGQPAQGRDRYFSYHLNGPGHRCTNYCEWRDGGRHGTIVDLCGPAKLGFGVQDPADDDITITINGTDVYGHPLSAAGTTDIPLSDHSWFYPDTESPIFYGVTRIRKPVTNGPVFVIAYPEDQSRPYPIAIIDAKNTEGSFRRMILSKDAEFVQVAYRRKTAKITSVNDLIALHSSMAIELAVKAVMHYKKDDPDLGKQYEAEATRMLQEEEFVKTPPVSSPIQVSGPQITDSSDQLD